MIVSSVRIIYKIALGISQPMDKFYNVFGYLSIQMSSQRITARQRNVNILRNCICFKII